MVDQHKTKELIVYENERITFQQCLDKALKAASVFRDVYGVQKGNHVGIISRNYPEYLIAFWATQLLGGVAVLINAWLPHVPLNHCVANAKCKVSAYIAYIITASHSALGSCRRPRTRW